MTRIIFISDTHGLHHSVEIPDGDILVYVGDGLNTGDASDFWKFSAWFNELPHKHKIYVPGNHDEYFEGCSLTAQSSMPKVRVLVDKALELEGIKFYGSPWTPTFLNWFFMKGEEELPEYWGKIPDDTDILLTHGPPNKILDLAPDGTHCGSESLRKRVFKVSPKYHVFGHIHEGYGYEKIDGISFINVSVCTGQYEPTNSPVVLEWGANSEL